MEGLPKNHIEEKTHGGVELFSLNEEQKNVLRERIKESGGLIRVFIHPESIFTNDEEIENQKRVRSVLKRAIHSEKSPPVIILENGVHIDVWKKIFEKSNLPQDVYLVPTIQNFPYPIVPGIPEPTERDEDGHLMDDTYPYVKEGFKTLILFLSGVGAKKVLVGGNRLEITKSEISGCVGNFISFLKDYSTAEIKLSLGTAPLNRNDVRKLYPDLI